MKKKHLLFVLMVILQEIFCYSEEYPCYELLLIDGQGRMVGYNPTYGNIVEEIPQGTYTEESFPGIPVYKWLDIGQPSEGKYILYVIGKDTGAYEISFTAFDKNANDIQKVLTGEIFPGEIKKIFIDYTPEVGGITHIFEDNTPPVTEIEVGGPKFEAFGVNYISKSTKICFNSTDPIVVEGASGVKYTEYRIDNSS